ncbi:MAG: ComF family protein [Flavobacteriales bacterium]|nr:ComF family protein [Flavobacteriales bacterium]
MKALQAHIPLLDLFYPTPCSACSTPLLRGEELICLSCRMDMPYARIHDMSYNAIETRLMGRFPFEAATSLLYFVKNGRVQHLMHRLKYEGHREVGEWMGASLAEELLSSERFHAMDYLIPVPLHPRKKKMRGYNQSEVIAQGMEQKGYGKLKHALKRVVDNTSQTRKDSLERWANVQDVFELDDSRELEGKRLLLLDDVMTTGATLEACANQLIKVDGVRLYVATIACAEF